MQKKVGRRVFYGLTDKAQVLCSEGKTLEEVIKGITKKVLEVGGRKYGSYMMSIITSETRKDPKSIADVILGDEHKRMKGDISMRSHEDSSHRSKKSEISLLLLP